KMDMLPDHRGPIGIADDAIVLRVTAKLARAAGAKHPGLEPLALDANNVHNLFEDLAGALEKYVVQLQKKDVRGRSVEKILTHNLTRAAFDSDVTNESKRFKAERIATAADAPRAINELYKAMKDALDKAKAFR